jgi:hypothetical protein
LKIIQSQNFSKNLQFLLTVKTKPHLVIIFNQKVETSTINEFYKAGIPILSFDWRSLKTFKITYRALGSYNFVDKNLKLTFFFLFYSLLKKTPLTKKKSKLNYKKTNFTHKNQQKKNRFKYLKKLGNI